MFNKKTLCFVMALVCVFIFVSCGSNELETRDNGVSKGEAESETVSGSDEQGIKAGQLTAGVWNDNANYNFWLTLNGNNSDNASFKALNKNLWGLYTEKRQTVKVFSSGQAVYGEKVEITDSEGDVKASGVTDVSGLAYLFYNFENYETYSVNAGGVTETMVYGQTTEIEVTSFTEHKDAIDLMFVIDATGSMGDELTYIQSEVTSVIERVKGNSQTSVRLGFVFYRDEGDDYITRLFDFSDDIDAQVKNLKQQSASGGGDYPEAVHKALSVAVNEAGWSTDNTTKLIIHILDAPPHDTVQISSAYKDEIYAAKEKGISIIPVAASGVDTLTEYLLRSEAILTGGDYVFITDDSGIGNKHLEASVGKYVVEYLDSCLVRLIKGHHTGDYGTAVYYGNEVRQ